MPEARHGGGLGTGTRERTAINGYITAHNWSILFMYIAHSIQSTLYEYIVEEAERHDLILLHFN